MLAGLDIASQRKVPLWLWSASAKQCFNARCGLSQGRPVALSVAPNTIFVSTTLHRVSMCRMLSEYAGWGSVPWNRLPRLAP